MSWLTKCVRGWRQNHLPLPLLRKMLRKDGIERPRLSFQTGDFYEVTLEKTEGGLHVRIGRSGEASKFWFWTSHRLAVFAKIVQMTSAKRLCVRASLHDWSDVPGVMTPCSREPRAILVPDPDFYNSGGYARLRTHARTAPTWMARSDLILWRGSTTGNGARLPRSSDDLSDPDTLPRIRMCAVLRGLPHVDVRIANVVQTGDSAGVKALLHSAGLMGDQVPQECWTQHKFAIDIDGNANAWSNFFRSLLFGCCVLKILSPRGFRQWYYDRLVPFEHFVPVRSDMTDLHQQIEWCRANLELCAQIAANGQRLAFSMGLQEELTDAARRLEIVQLASP